MLRLSGSSTFERVLIDWFVDQPTTPPRVPVEWMTQEQVAAELQQIDRDRDPPATVGPDDDPPPF